MVLETQETTVAKSVEVFIPEFGILDSRYVEPDKKYQGRLYRASADAIKQLSETFGFTARFEAPSIRASCLDLNKGEGRIIFEIDRNTKPTDLNLRYASDRWSSVDPSGSQRDGLKPWIKTFYSARFFPEKVFLIMADQVRIKPEDVDKFYVRINLKDRTIGLIAEDKYLEQFPGGAFQVFALPDGQIATIPVVDLQASNTESASSTTTETFRQTAGPAVDPGVRYATYSKSEIDRLLRLQSDTITNTLSGKISGQQRLFQEAVAAQEKSLAKIVDRLAQTLEDTRAKLGEQTTNSQKSNMAELDQFKTHLAKELDQFKAHVNRNIVPISKTIEEKIQSLGAAAKPDSSGETLKPLIITAVTIILLAVVAGSGIILSSVIDLKAQLSRSASK